MVFKVPFRKARRIKSVASTWCLRGFILGLPLKAYARGGGLQLSAGFLEKSRQYFLLDMAIKGDRFTQSGAPHKMDLSSQ